VHYRVLIVTVTVTEWPIKHYRAALSSQCRVR